MGAIALSIIVSQFFVQSYISKQQDDSRIINIAGRQRMLSQQISKFALQRSTYQDTTSATQEKLNEALEQFKTTHLALQGQEIGPFTHQQNSPAIQKMFAALEEHFEPIYTAGKASVQYRTISTTAQLDSILAHEGLFLQGMNAIVYQYDAEARAKVAKLKEIEFYLLVVSLAIIASELLFIFIPLAKNVRGTVQKLVTSQNQSHQMARELNKLYEELGKSYQDLEAVNSQPKAPVLLATLQPTGEFIQAIPLAKLLGKKPEAIMGRINNLLIENGYKPDVGKGLIDLVSSGRSWVGELKLENEGGDLLWIDSFLIPVLGSQEVKWVGRDITEFKEAKARSREINKERIEKSVKEQQYRSSLILRGQEEERKRLSRELHDGVGQMLSGMKMLLESTVASSGPMKKRLDDARGLMKSIIQEIRRVSFNLTPSSLEDFGLLAAVQKFCTEYSKFTETELVFENKTRFINRLSETIETNLYRIIQEAVNNALKYSKANRITIRFVHDVQALVITIADNGKGFNLEDMTNTGHFEKAGHGIFNMRERASYIGGEFEIDTQLGQGTCIRIKLDLTNHD